MNSSKKAKKKTQKYTDKQKKLFKVIFNYSPLSRLSESPNPIWKEINRKTGIHENIFYTSEGNQNGLTKNAETFFIESFKEYYLHEDLDSIFHSLCSNNEYKGTLPESIIRKLVKIKNSELSTDVKLGMLSYSFFRLFVNLKDEDISEKELLRCIAAQPVPINDDISEPVSHILFYDVIEEKSRKEFNEFNETLFPLGYSSRGATYSICNLSKTNLSNTSNPYASYNASNIYLYEHQYLEAWKSLDYNSDEMIPGMLISKADLLIRSEDFKVQDPIEYNRLLDGADDYNKIVNTYNNTQYMQYILSLLDKAYRYCKYEKRFPISARMMALRLEAAYNDIGKWHISEWPDEFNWMINKSITCKELNNAQLTGAMAFLYESGISYREYDAFACNDLFARKSNLLTVCSDEKKVDDFRKKCLFRSCDAGNPAGMRKYVEVYMLSESILPEEAYSLLCRCVALRRISGDYIASVLLVKYFGHLLSEEYATALLKEAAENMKPTAELYDGTNVMETINILLNKNS